MEPDAVEIRVVGCLIEKQRTTPDVYPLSLNALRLACNQSTNRDPVVDYDEETVVEALRRLALRGWTRLASGAGSRARKYRHLLDEALGVDGAELSLLAVLMLRGAADPRRAEAAQRAPARASPTSPPSTRPSTAWSSAAWSPATSAGRARRRIATSSCSGRPRAAAPTESPAPSSSPRRPRRTNGSAADRPPRADRARAGRAPRAARDPALGTGGG